MHNFKIGDLAIVNGETGFHHLFESGTVVVIINITKDMARCSNGESLQLLEINQLSPIDSGDIPIRFRRGDKVKVTKSASGLSGTEMEIIEAHERDSTECLYGYDGVALQTRKVTPGIYTCRAESGTKWRIPGANLILLDRPSLRITGNKNATSGTAEEQPHAAPLDLINPTALLTDIKLN